jgi:hypothetical protein
MTHDTHPVRRHSPHCAPPVQRRAAPYRDHQFSCFPDLLVAPDVAVVAIANGADSARCVALVGEPEPAEASSDARTCFGS